MLLHQLHLVLHRFGKFAITSVFLGSVMISHADNLPQLPSIAIQALALEKDWIKTPKADYFMSIRALLKNRALAKQNNQTDENGLIYYKQLLEIGQQALQKKIANLKTADRKPFYRAQFELAKTLLSVDLEPIAQTSDYPVLRNAYAKMLLEYRTQLKQAAEAIKVEGYYLVNVSPPANTGGLVISGMDPKAIPDPAERQAYEAAIEANHQRGAALNERSYLEQYLKFFTEMVEEHLREQKNGVTEEWQKNGRMGSGLTFDIHQLPS